MVFNNKAYSVISDIKINSLEIGFRNEKNMSKMIPYFDKFNSKYFLNPQLIVDTQLFLEKKSNLEKSFSQFYFYFSQFPLLDNYCKFKIEIETKIQDNSEVINSILEVEIKMLPEFDEVNFCNKIKIENYLIYPKEKIKNKDK